VDDVHLLPPPDFQGGSAEAYQAFAEILVAFYQAGDNFDFLANNHLFQTPLRDVLASGQESDWTFEQLTTDLSEDTRRRSIPQAHSPKKREALFVEAWQGSIPPWGLRERATSWRGIRRVPTRPESGASSTCGRGEIRELRRQP